LLTRELFKGVTQWAIAYDHKPRLRSLVLHQRHRLNQIATAFFFYQPSDEKHHVPFMNLCTGHKKRPVHTDVVDPELRFRKAGFDRTLPDKFGHAKEGARRLQELVLPLRVK